MTANIPHENKAVADTEAQPQAAAFSSKELFGTPRDIKIMGYSKPWNEPTKKTPPREPSFHFRGDLVLDIILWWYSGDRALKLIGPTGSGKTELVMQFFAALNLPLLTVPANPRTEAQQIIGGMAPSESGGFKFVPGAALIAAKEGLTLLIDEYNVIDPGEAVGLNALLEGRQFTVPETGETIVPHRDFRVIVTQNPKGDGYRGRRLQDVSNDDRFVDLLVPYMSAAEEAPLLARDIAIYTKKDPTDQTIQALAETMVKFANNVRDAYMGNNTQPGALPCTMSTRVLRRWCKWWIAAGQIVPGGENKAHYALRRVLTNRQSPEVAEALHSMLEAVGEPRVI
jgi:cobaltochelatase CobS